MSETGRELEWSLARWGDGGVSAPPLDPHLMALLLEHISTRVAIVGRDWRYSYANQEALRFIGLPAERVIGKHMSEILDARVYESFIPIFERLFAGESLHLRGWVDYERQGRRYREQVLRPYAPHGGPVQCIVICGLDHTEARLNQQELIEKQAQLRASEALKAAIFDHTLAALVSTDAAGCIVEFNPSAEAMFGHRREDVIGRQVGKLLVPARFRGAHEDGLHRLLAGAAPRVMGQRMELQALRADGSEFPMEMVLFQTNTEGAVFYTASVIDLSERHQAARQIERQREALRQSEKLTTMGSLLAGVAHELNNPLAIVLGRSTLLEEKCESLPDLKREAQRIHEAAYRCGRIVRTFLNMARSRPAERTAVSMNEVVMSAADTLGYTYRSHDVELVLNLDPVLPTLTADGDQLGQIVLNLLVNAQQVLAEAPLPRRVTVTTSVAPPDDDHVRASVRLCVEDTGPGIPPEVRSRLFEPFYTTKPVGSGTGLGLSVSRSVAREHGGELMLEAAEPGRGAVFRLSLPLGDAPPALSVAAPAVDPEAGSLARVLVVDDEPEVAALLRDMLENAGYDVAIAESGAIALELLDAAPFEAIVSDLRMPDMDGAELWRQVAKRHPRLAGRLMFITGDTLSPMAVEQLQTTQCHGLEKPFSREDLLACVAELLR